VSDPVESEPVETAADGGESRGTATRTTPPLPAIDPGDLPASPATTAAAADRHAGPLPNARARRRYRLIVAGLAVLALVLAFANLAWDNPMPIDTQGFWIIAEMRSTSLIIMVIVGFCQATATVAFQTVANNRIITPSIMGFESLYAVVQTAAVFFIGAAGVTAVQGVPQFLGQVALMVLFSALLYGWLLTGRYGNMQVMLLVGIILGGGLGAMSTFMQRMLTPSEFDILTARLIGSIANADASYLWISIPLVVAAGGALWLSARRLNVLALGRQTAINLGVNHRRQSILVLLLVSVLMAVSTALVGPMMFLGFLVAMISYQLADTHDHRYVFPMAWLLGFVTLAGAYFVLKNIFYAQGAVGIIIEIIGGSFFLGYLLRKGRL